MPSTSVEGSSEEGDLFTVKHELKTSKCHIIHIPMLFLFNLGFEICEKGHCFWGRDCISSASKPSVLTVNSLARLRVQRPGAAVALWDSKLRKQRG